MFSSTTLVFDIFYSTYRVDGYDDAVDVWCKCLVGMLGWVPVAAVVPVVVVVVHNLVVHTAAEASLALASGRKR